MILYPKLAVGPIENYLSGSASIVVKGVAIKSIQKELAGISPGYVVLVVANAKRYTGAPEKMVEYLLNDAAMSGVYVSMNKPFEYMSRELESAKLDVGRIFFIDAITETATRQHQISDRCLFMSSPKYLNELAVLLEQAIQKIPKGSRFILVDSADTMLLYNKADAVIKFIHALTGKMRLWGMTGVVIFIKKKGDDGIVSTLSQLFDKVIRLN